LPAWVKGCTAYRRRRPWGPVTLQRTPESDSTLSHFSGACTAETSDASCANTRRSLDVTQAPPPEQMGNEEGRPCRGKLQGGGGRVPPRGDPHAQGPALSPTLHSIYPIGSEMRGNVVSAGFARGLCRSSAHALRNSGRLGTGQPMASVGRWLANVS